MKATTTLKEIKQLIKDCKAIDITTIDDSKTLKVVSLSFGVRGYNGAIFECKRTGQIYVALNRKGIEKFLKNRKIS